MNTKKKNARGITLIALVITIIVLLILAGVTINALSGENGIITKSKEAKIKTEKSRTIEKINLAILTAMTKGDGDIDNATLREELEKEGYSVEVIDMFTIKPLDEKLLIKEAKGKSKIVTIENHSIYGGLGSAVSEVIAENGISVPVKRIGVKEKFGQVGTAEFLQEEFGLTAKQIKETICQF